MAEKAHNDKVAANTACRFYVDIGGQKQASFTEVSGLSVEMNVEEVQEGGNNHFVHRLPGQCKVGNLVLKGGVVSASEFFKWMMEIAQGRITRRNISVILYDLKGAELMRWNFINAFPIKWTGPNLKADDTLATIESLEIAHEGLKVD